ncbi:hypothetical protein L4C34_05985 [Vibrio profundum]|uniref:hypothetical protein n=1 Tax=Vibrio profundum TaxID=2910247 RepID=UPI003D0BAAE9
MLSNTSFNSETAKNAGSKSKRGKARATLLYDAVRESKLLELGEQDSNEDVEKAILGHIASKAFSPAGEDSAVYLKLLLDRVWPKPKPTYEPVFLDLDENATPLELVNTILKETSEGKIAPDVAQVLVTLVEKRMKIYEVTELERKLEEIEEMLV